MKASNKIDLALMKSLDRTMEFEKLDKRAESMLVRLDEVAENMTITKKAVLSTDSPRLIPGSS